MDELNAIVSLWGKSCMKDGDGVVTIEGRAVTSGEATQIDAEVIRLQTEYDALEYSRNRKAEYPDWSLQLEKIADDGIDKWKTEMVDPVKAKYPKP